MWAIFIGWEVLWLATTLVINNEISQSTILVTMTTFHYFCFSTLLGVLVQREKLPSSWRKTKQLWSLAMHSVSPPSELKWTNTSWETLTLVGTRSGIEYSLHSQYYFNVLEVPVHKLLICTCFLLCTSIIGKGVFPFLLLKWQWLFLVWVKLPLEESDWKTVDWSFP